LHVKRQKKFTEDGEALPFRDQEVLLMAGTWSTLANPPPHSVDTMLLLTDGTVIAHQLDNSGWYRLTPTTSGSYENGSWSTIASLIPNPAIPTTKGGPAYGPKFFGSAVLRDGRVLVIGGEYNFGISADTAAATIYDPVTDVWTNLGTPAGWTHIGDVPLCVMPDGRVLLGFLNGTDTAFFDPVTASYTAGPNKADRCAEESFTLLPDGTVLAVQCTSIPGAEKYVPSTNSWVSAGSTPSTLPQSCPGIVAEIGPTVLLASGHALVIGATGNTAIYNPPASPGAAGTWSAGPTIQNGGATLFPIDAPAVLLPNGKVLLTASPSPPCSFPGPTTFFEYDSVANTLAVVPSPVNGGAPCFRGRFILLPTGQVLYSNQSGTVSIYTPDGAPHASWRPIITSFPASVFRGFTYTLSGQQLNGLSQACFYGDDATMATNYPIVRVTSLSTGAVTYLRTANHSTMAVATGTATVSTSVTIPSTLPFGSYTLEVIANGIASAPITITVTLIKFKEHKEFKELKEFKIEHKEFKEIEKPIVENKLKDAEDISQIVQVIDPALAAALETMNARLTTLEHVPARAPIPPELRPAVGKEALAHSAHAAAAPAPAVPEAAEREGQHSRHPVHGDGGGGGGSRS
jgi:hypothetical protein